MAAHATVSAEGAPMRDWQHAVEVAMSDPRVAGAAPYIETESLLQGPRKQPAIVRGVIPAEEGKVSVLAKKMQQGSVDSLTPGSYNIVIGKELALWLGVDVGDSVVVLLSDTQATPLGAMPRLKRFTVSGIFRSRLQRNRSRPGRGQHAGSGARAAHGWRHRRAPAPPRHGSGLAGGARSGGEIAWPVSGQRLDPGKTPTCTTR